MDTQILFVEDEDAIRETLMRFFARRGYAVLGARSRHEALRLFRAHVPDLAVMDVMLHEGPDAEPGDDTGGFAVCSALRESGFMQPIIFLSGRTGEQSELMGFSCGADDYLCKPFSLPVLQARIEAILKRTGRAAARDTHQFGAVTVDLGRHSISHPGATLRLSRKECELLAYFMSNRQRPLTRAELLREVWGYHPELTTRTVDTHVLTIRKKLRDRASRPRFIETLHNVGYQFIGKPS